MPDDSNNSKIPVGAMAPDASTSPVEGSADAVVAAHGRFYIHAPAVKQRSCHAGNCPDCKRRTRFLGFFQDWYGWNQTCLRCGRVWDDGEWIALVFERGARAKSVERAKARWRRLTALAASPAPEVSHVG